MSGVRGPNSALTEFLRSQGITVANIRRRRAAAERSNGAQDRRSREPTSPLPDADIVINAANAAATARAALNASSGTAVCASCGSKFTLTVYTRQLKDGGVLCRACAQERKPAKRTVEAAARKRRKKLAESLLEMRANKAPTLQELCISLVAEYIHEIDELGDLSQMDVNRIARIVTRNRKLTPKTLQLFAMPMLKQLELWDCSALPPESYNALAAMAPNLERLTLAMCGQLDGESARRLARLPLSELNLDGPFLVRKEAWVDVFRILGGRLNSFAISSVYRFCGDVLKALVDNCPELESLRLARLSQFNDQKALALLSELPLKKLQLCNFEPGALTDEIIEKLMMARGPELETLVLHSDELGDGSIAAIGACCNQLTHLELVDMRVSSVAVENMFNNWIERNVNQGLTHLSLERCFDLDFAAVNAALLAAPAIANLNINSLKKTTPAIIPKIAKLNQITRLDLGFLGYLEPQHVYMLSKCESLQLLLVFGNIRLSGMPLPSKTTVIGTM